MYDQQLSDLYLYFAHCQPAVRVRASVDHYLFCDDPTSLQSLFPWIWETIQTGEVKRCAPLPGSTPADLHFFVGSLLSGQGVLNLLCRGLPQTPFVSRNEDWVSPPHLTYVCLHKSLWPSLRAFIQAFVLPSEASTFTPTIVHSPGISWHTSICTA